jgi:hypothetical protein
MAWHLSPGCVLVPGTEWRFTDGTDTLVLCTSEATGWTAACQEYPWSPAYGAAVLAPALRLSYEGPLPAECVTLGGWNQPEYTLVKLNSETGVSVWVAQREDRCRIAMFAAGAGTWYFEGIESDMELLGFDFVDHTLTHFFCAGGTKVSLNGKPTLLPSAQNYIREWCAGDATELFQQEQTRAWFSQRFPAHFHEQRSGDRDP